MCDFSKEVMEARRQWKGMYEGLTKSNCQISVQTESEVKVFVDREKELISRKLPF